MEQIELLLRLNAAVGPVRARELLKFAEPLRLTPREAAPAFGGDEEKARRALETARAFDADAERAECERRGIRLVAEGDPLYPAGLAGLDADSPLLLYVEGDFRAPSLAAAVVGTRAASPYGLRMGRRFGHDLAAAGVCVVSGLARGIDTEAHEGALTAAGKTWAVFGTGLGAVYPPENEPLARRIVEGGGALASESHVRARPERWSFPRRNRLIAALSWATVVVEARLEKARPAGALDTAAQAAALGRDVYAVPGPADSPTSAGPLKLLKEGAALACSARDVLSVLAPDRQLAARAESGRQARRTGALSLEYRKILQLLESDTRTADQLALESGLDAPRLSNILFELELQGLVTPAPGQRYAKKDKV